MKKPRLFSQAGLWCRECRLLLDSFDLDDQLYVLGEAPINSVGHTEGRAIDGGFKVAAAGLAFEHGVHIAVELVGFERNWLRLAHQREVAGDLRDLVTAKSELVA